MRSRSLTIISLFALIIFTSCPAFASGGEYSSAQKWDLVFRVMNFAVFLGVLLYFGKKPIQKFFQQRRESIARNIEYLETQARNLEEQTAIMNKQIADIASERDSILAQYEAIGQKEAERIISEAREAAKSIVRKAQIAIEQETKSARNLLLQEVVSLSTKAAEDLVKKNITVEDQKRLAEEFMAQVENLKGTTH